MNYMHINPDTLATTNLTMRAEIALRIYTATIGRHGLSSPISIPDMDLAINAADLFIETYNKTQNPPHKG